MAFQFWLKLIKFHSDYLHARIKQSWKKKNSSFDVLIEEHRNISIFILSMLAIIKRENTYLPGSGDTMIIKKENTCGLELKNFEKNQAGIKYQHICFKYRNNFFI